MSSLLENWQEKFDKEFRFNSDVIARDGNYDGTELRNDLMAFISSLLQAQHQKNTQEFVEKIASLRLKETKSPCPPFNSSEISGFNVAVVYINSKIDSIIHSLTQSANKDQ